MGTMTFREFLEKKALEQHHPERKKRREEWIAAVERLLVLYRGLFEIA